MKGRINFLYESDGKQLLVGRTEHWQYRALQECVLLQHLQSKKFMINMLIYGTEKGKSQTFSSNL